MKRKKSIYQYIIYVLIIIIIILVVILSIGKKDENIESTATPTPIPSKLNITLEGDDEVFVIEGHEYIDPGYNAYDTVDGNLNDKVVVEGIVDTNIVGEYIIKYRVTNSAGKTKEETRTVNVIKDLDVEIDYNPKELTNKDVAITIKVIGEYFDYMKDPDGDISKNKELKYDASTNDEYLFSIVRPDGTKIEKSVTIDNIDKTKPSGSCKNTVTNEKTTIAVQAEDNNGIRNYKYNYNGTSKELESNTFSINEKASSVSVTIYDKAGNSNTVNCKKIDDTWPVIGNPNYTSHAVHNISVTKKYGRMNYIIYFPDYVDIKEKNPLVIFLHGYGEFGTNLNNTLSGSSEFTKNMTTGRFQEKAIFLAPQCYYGHNWASCFDDLTGLINQIVKDFNVDTNRISMTGHSLGGKAVFDYIASHRGVLAAAAPLAPSAIHKDVEGLKGLKIAVFTGTKDGLFSSNRTDTAYLIEHGVNLKFYSLQNITHSSQKAMYSGTNVIEWLVSQSKE